MQNVLAAVFKKESEGYQAMTQLKQNTMTDNYAILQAALVKKEGTSFSVCDSFDSGFNTADDCLAGGLLGMLVGCVAGPIGMLLMGSAGALTGSLVDLEDAEDNSSMLEAVINKMNDGDVVLVAYIEETDESDIDGKLGYFDVEIIRYDAAVIMQQLEEAQEMQKEMERQARLKLRAEKKAENSEKIEEIKQKIAADFADLKAKFKKNDDSESAAE